MSIHTDLFQLIYDLWDQKTEIVFPNTSSAQRNRNYLDLDTLLEVSVFDVGSKTLGVPVEASTTRTDSYLLQCNLIGKKLTGYGDLYGYMEDLEGFFRNKTLTQGANTFYFEESRRVAAVPDDAFYVLPWTCPFTVFVN